MNWCALITADPDVLHGQARFVGTRIPASVVLDCLASGMSDAEILNDYPTLPAQAVRVTLTYAAELARDDVLPSPLHGEGSCSLTASGFARAD